VPAGGVTFWGWLFVALGLISDVAGHAQAYAKSQRGSCVRTTLGPADQMAQSAPS
jgi:hypothetical protein